MRRIGAVTATRAEHSLLRTAVVKLGIIGKVNLELIDDEYLTE